MYVSFWEFLKVALLSPTLILYIPALPLILGSVSLSLSYLFAYFFSDVFPGHPGLFSSFIISSNNFSTFPHPPSPVYYKFQINLCLLSYCFLVFFSFKCVTFFLTSLFSCLNPTRPTPPPDSLLSELLAWLAIHGLKPSFKASTILHPLETPLPS